MTVVIRTHQLTRRFGTIAAVDRCDLEIERGERVALVGPNGSGRTTLLQMLATTLAPSSGAIEVCGVDAVRRPVAARPHLMHVSSRPWSGGGLAVGEHVRFVADARGAKLSPSAIAAALSRAEVPQDHGVDQLSAGLRQRLALAIVLLVQPAVLLLDDPLAGMDAAGRSRFAEWINESRGGPMTIVAAMNHDEQVVALSDSMIEMRAGRIGAKTRVRTPAVPVAVPTVAVGGA